MAFDRQPPSSVPERRGAIDAVTAGSDASARPVGSRGDARPDAIVADTGVVPPRPRPVRPDQPAHRRPDPSPMRLALGFAGLAAATAVATAVVAPRGASAGSGTAVTTVLEPVAPTPAASVRHVIRYVHLAPGQTPPPSAVVAAPLPAPTPRIVVITTTQSGVVKP